jgi:ankyrin repeat protein
LGYNPNQRDAAKNTPLHIAVKENRIDYVTELLKYGANPSIPDSELKLPVTVALEQRNFKLARLLQRAGAEYGQITKNFNSTTDAYLK